MKFHPQTCCLTHEDISEDKRKFQTLIKILYSSDKISVYVLQSLFSLLLANSSSNLSNPNETPAFANLITRLNYRCLKRNNSCEYAKITSYSKYLNSISRIKMDVLLDINCILWSWPDHEAFKLGKEQSYRQRLWKTFILIFKELIESDPVILTKSNVINLICETQKILEELKMRCHSLKKVIYELLIGLKKIGRIIHLFSLTTKRNENSILTDDSLIKNDHNLRKPYLPHFEISCFSKYYEKSKEFEKSQWTPLKKKDQILEYCKWKLKTWKEEKRVNKLKTMKEVHIRCKICLKDITCSIFREHSEYCKEKGLLSTKLNKMKKNANKFVTLFQEIRIYLLTKTKMDIKNLRNLKSRFDLSSHNLLLKSQTMVPLDSMKYIDLDSLIHENESIDDGCSLEMSESLDPLTFQKTQSLIQPIEMTESLILPSMGKSQLAIKESKSILESDTRNLSPNFNSTPSSSNSNNRNTPTNMKTTEPHLSKMSDFAKKLLKTGQQIMTDSLDEKKIELFSAQINKGYYEELPKQTKFSPGLKESKFKALKKIDSMKEDESFLDEIEESDILRKNNNENRDEIMRKSSGSIKENLLEEILKKNLQKLKVGTLPKLKEKNESFIEFYSDANFNSSGLPSENSSPKILSPALLNLQKGESFSSGIDPIFEKPSVENTPYLERNDKKEDFQQITENICNLNKMSEKKVESESNLVFRKSQDREKKSEERKHFEKIKKEDKRSDSREFIDQSRSERKVKNLEKKLVEKRNQDKLYSNKFISDSEEDSIFNEEQSKENQNLEGKEKFTVRNRTKTLLVIGTKEKEKDKSHERIKHKHLTEMVSSEFLNPMERIKSQKEIYKMQKKLIKKNDDGIQACILFSELFTYISENDYVERLGYKIQKVLSKLDEILLLLPDKKVDERCGVEESKDFLQIYQETGEKLQRISLLLYKLQAELLKGHDQKIQRENVRKSFIKKDKKQNSDSVEVTKRNRFLEKTEKINTSKSKTNIKISFTKSYRDSLHSASILSCSKSGQTTPSNLFKFPDFTSLCKKKESILTTKNLEKLQEKETAQRKLTTSKTTSHNTQDIKEEVKFSKKGSQISIQKNLTSLNLVPDIEKIVEKEKSPDVEDEDADKKNIESFQEKNLNIPTDESKNEINVRDFQSSQLILEKTDLFHQEGVIKPVENGDFSRSLRRNKTYNDIEMHFNKKTRKEKNLKEKESSQGSKYMAVINLFKKGNKLDDIPHQTMEEKKMNNQKKKNHGVKVSTLQNILRRSSVDVLSPLTSPDDISKNIEKKRKKSLIFSAGNSPGLKNKAEEGQNFILKEESKTQNTIFSNFSKTDINLIGQGKTEVNIPSSRKINLMQKLLKGHIESSSSDSQDESFVLQEEDYFKGYYSDSYMPSQHVLMDLDKKDKNEIGIENFEFINLIGKGAFGRVYLVKRKQTGDQYAMKIINTMDNMNKNKYLSLKNESKVFDLVYSDFVVKALFKFSHEKFYCFVMEYMYGGDFNKILQKYQSLDNRTARFYIAEIVLAVEHLHNLGIVHRDLKPDNILLDVKGHIKLTDFGLSEVAIATLTKHKQTPTLSREEKFKNLIEKLKINDDFIIDHNINYKLGVIKTQVQAKNIEDDPENESPSTLRKSIKKVNKNMHRIIGTPDYIAPEIINGTGSLNHPCIDWWSVGVILFEFLTGIPPFNDDTPEKIFENISNLKIEWDQISIGYEDDQMTPQAADLIKKLLNLDPEKRLGSKNVDEIKNHVFFHGLDWNNIINSEPPIIPEIIHEIIQEEEKKNRDEIAEKDPFLKQVVSIQVVTKNEEKRKFFEEEEDECHIRYDLLEKENQITLEENFLKMEDKTINEENSSSLSMSVKEKDVKSKSILSRSDFNTNISKNSFNE